jgi:hypothetical protein
VKQKKREKIELKVSRDQLRKFPAYSLLFLLLLVHSSVDRIVVSLQDFSLVLDGLSTLSHVSQAQFCCNTALLEVSLSSELSLGFQLAHNIGVFPSDLCAQVTKSGELSAWAKVCNSECRGNNDSLDFLESEGDSNEAMQVAQCSSTASSFMGNHSSN